MTNFIFNSSPKAIMGEQQIVKNNIHNPMGNVPRIEKKVVIVAKTAANNHAWLSRFSYQLEGNILIISLRIATLAVEQVRSVRMESAKKKWLTSIDEKWNDRFELVLSNGLMLPIKFKVKFSPINPDHQVVVREGKSADQHNWTIDMPVAAAAHELGHMLGAFDEYKFGALSLQKPLVDQGSIMGSRVQDGYPYPRHLFTVLNDVRNELNDQDAKIIFM